MVPKGVGLPGAVAHPTRSSRAGTLYLLFTLTGVGLVLPGALLPLLVAQWAWGDGRSGVLFFLFFLGSFFGAFCARGTLGPMLSLGTLAWVVPLALFSWLHGPMVFLAFLMCGFGLGITMTGLSLVQSRRSGVHRLRELTRLNLLWACGACAGPFLLLRSCAAFGLSETLQGCAAAILLTGATVAWQLRREPVPASGAWHAWRHLRDLSASYAITLPLATGIEAGMGGWLTTLAARQHGGGATMVSAVSALWMGLLTSRLLFSSRHAPVRNRWVMPAFALFTVLGLAAELGGQFPVSSVVGAFLVGFGIGPLYPYLLSRNLDHGEAGNAGFLVAGAGSSLLPLLIGVLSQMFHSLRMGLLAPLVGSIVLCAMLLREQGRDARQERTPLAEEHYRQTSL